MSNWKVKKLSDLAEVQGGGTPKTKIDEYWNGDIVWLSPTDLPDIGNISIISDSKRAITEEGLNNSSAKLLPKGAVIYSTRATIGKLGIAGVDLATNQGFTNFICNDNVYNKFLCYALLNYTDDIHSLSNSTTFSEVSKSAIKDFKIPAPPLEEQINIVSKLDYSFERIDNAIALLEENIQSVEELVGSVLDEYCSDGDTELKKVCIINPKKSEVRNLDTELDVSFLPMKDLKEKSIHFDPQEERKLGDVYSGYTFFRDNDVLLAKVTPCFENGKAGIAKDLTNGIGFGSSEYHVLRTNDNILPEWIYYSLFSEEFRQYGVKNMTGSSGLKRVPTKFLKSWKIQVPDLSVQKELVEKFELIHVKTQKLANVLRLKVEYLKSLKRSLLDQAFKGELV